MGLLSGDIQVQPGVLHALIEFMQCAASPVATSDIQRLMQPESLTAINNGKAPPIDLVPKGLHVCCELGLITEANETWQLGSKAAAILPQRLYCDLPKLLRSAILAPDESMRPAETRPISHELTLALAWFLAQDAWSPSHRFASGVDSWEERQLGQFGISPVHVNPTKMVPLRRWAIYLGLATADPIDNEFVIPDPTIAVKDFIQTMDFDIEGLSAASFVEALSEHFSVFDLGQTRRTATEHLLKGQLPWERERDEKVSPSLSLALLRLERGGFVLLKDEADTPPSKRRLLIRPDHSTRVVDRILPGKTFMKVGAHDDRLV